MITIIDYGLGNLKSVLNAFHHLGFEAKISNQETEILKADKVVLPGVGAFNDAMTTIKTTGFDKVIKEVIALKKPILGICVGMQVLFERSFEYGCHEGLAILKGQIVPLKNTEQTKLKIPHIGWNSIEINKESRLFKNIEAAYLYFVHSYYLETSEEYCCSYTNYGSKIVASIEKNNIFATQFHPEKSGELGLKILKNFGEL